MSGPTPKQLSAALRDVAGGLAETTDWLSAAYAETLDERQFDDERGLLALETTPKHWWRLLCHMRVTVDVLQRASVLMGEATDD